MNLEEQARLAFCEIGRRVWQRQMVAANDGNFSFRLEENLILCTPTLISKGFMKPEDMILVDLEGNQVAGHRKLTSEIRIHLYIYQERPDLRSVIHVHPPHATAFALTRHELPKCLLAEAELVLGEIPIAPYETTGTWEFARSIEPWVRNHEVFLFANHGAMTSGYDPFDAYYRMEVLEQYCRVLILAKQIGDWTRIDGAGIEALRRIRKQLGLSDYRSEGEACQPGVAGNENRPPLPAEPFRPLNRDLEDCPKFRDPALDN